MRRIIASLLVLAFASVPIGLAGVSRVHAAVSAPVVTLSNYAAGASGVQYTITFALPSGKLADVDRFTLRYLQLSNVPTNPTGGQTLKVNGDNITDIRQAFDQDLGGDETNTLDCRLSVYVPLSKLDSTETQITIVLPSAIGLVNPATQQSWSAGSHYPNNPAQNQWTIGVEIYYAGEINPTLLTSAAYTIASPGVRGTSAVVTPNTVGSIAAWDISFATSPSGAFGGAGGVIDVQFPAGFVIPSTVSVGTVTLRVGATDYVPGSVFCAGQTVSVFLPSTLYIPANVSIHILIRTDANLRNVAVAGTNYQLLIRTTGDYVFVATAVFGIGASQVSNLAVSVAPTTVSSIAAYTVSMRASAAGALVAGTGTIAVTLPDAVTLPISIAAGNVTVNGTPLVSAPQMAGKTITLRVPLNVAANASLTVMFSSAAGIRNPPAAGTYQVAVSTSADSGAAVANFVVAASKISPALVTVTPDVANAVGFYILNFTLGSGGALYAGNQITLSFPSGTQVPTVLSPSAFTVNGRPLTQALTVVGTKVSLTLAESIAANGQVIIVIAASAGIRNPRAGGTYSIAVSTTAEVTPVESQQFAVRDGAHSVAVVTPQTPDGANGYYITQPKVVLNANAPAGLGYVVKYRLDQGAFRTYVAGTELVIPEGQQTLEYYAEDSYGTREDTQTVQFKVFLGRPTLTLRSPANNAVIHTASVIIAGVTSGAISVTVNGESVPLAADGSFSREMPIAAEGPVSFKVRAVNQAGAVAEVTTAIVYTRQVRILLQVDYTKAYVNDTEVTLDGVPTIQKGRVLVPVRFISEAFGFDVAWDSIFNIVTIRASGRTMRLQVGNQTCDLFGKATRLDVPPTIIGNKLFVPLSLIGTSFGASVAWDAALRVVRIVYPAE